MSRCLAAVLMLGMADADEDDSILVDAQEIFEELAKQDCIPAMYLYTREAKKSWLSDWSELTNYYDKLKRKAYIPGIKDFLKVLRSEKYSPKLYLDEDEKESIAEDIDIFLEEHNIEDYVAFFEYLY